MKPINISTLILFFSFLLFGCGPSRTTSSGWTGATTPYYTQTGQTVNIRATNKGSVTSIDISVTFPSGVEQSLFDYNGEIDIRGTIDATPSCLTGRRSFNCKAQLAVGNITASSCNINGHSIGLRIFVKRGEKLKETYSVAGIEIYPDQACYQSR